LNSIFLHV